MDSHQTAAAEILKAAGLPMPAVAAILATQPADLRPSRKGIEVLIRMRRELGLLPGGTITYDSLVDYILSPSA